MGVTLYQLSASKGESVNKLKAASTEEISASCETLYEVAKELEVLVERFKF